ncbi:MULTISPECIES: DUF885 family protein [Olivibacter]|jgi:hypothetical protein|uniref:DUF885 family protein n=1 Tax=Olivibacter jilunii TaxID=985016 RepID=A0ABW6AX65_9SPHI|nr:DUF885 family protein [Olivibacter sp. 47]MCL4640921.1 DUF885 domain-containing protein [Olivibacter sp. UJ_SKK_5.1]MDM8177948.1 DUF885 family protein [Olivibacter sp. 47]
MINTNSKAITVLSKMMFVFLFLVQVEKMDAQPSDFYKQTSEIAPIIIRYDQDVHTILDFYSPRAANGFSYQPVLNSPQQRKRLNEINILYLNELTKFQFDKLQVNGQVDYLLLKNQIEGYQEELKEEDAQYQSIKPFIPFADSIYNLERVRLRGGSVDGEKIAGELHALSKYLETRLEELSKQTKIDKREAEFARGAVSALQARLQNVFKFYNDYDPMFTWWVPQTYEQLDSLLGKYAEGLAALGELRTTQKPDQSGIKGNPVGEAALNKLLRREYIPYSPQELIEIANQEFAWCDKELLKASAEMGFGSDWKKAQEQVKNSYVPVGQQPELIIKLYNDAKSFITERDWITWPELADETWGMIMMTPQRQLVNPFFTGGREISISYPTSGMSYEDKMMSMRGNNPYFSRGTVQHELIPGHHLQYFMNSRYKPYRREFRTPFYTEGWALYWELLLYENGFAKTPEERIGMLFWRMHRCARIIFSLNYHLGKWSPQECIDFLVNRVGFERANAEGEVRRSFQGGYPPLYQAAYLLGGIQIMGLKHELVDSGKMTMKAFHDAFMQENQMPIEMMRAILTNQKLSKDFKTKWKFYDFK